MSLVGETSSATSVASSANTIRVNARVGLVSKARVVRASGVAAVCGVRASQTRASGAVGTVSTCGTVLTSTDSASARSVTCGTVAVRVNTGIGLVGGVCAVRTSGVVWRN